MEVVFDMSNSDDSTKNYACKLCDKSYTLRHNLYRHMGSVHPSSEIETEKKNLQCPLCEDYAPKSTDRLSDHLKLVHDIQMITENHEFTSETDFFNWKNNLEAENMMNFIKVRGDKTIKDGSRVTYFKCHRSGKYSTKSIGKRRLKGQGSNKINGICPANMKFIRTLSGRILVKYQKTHVGHDVDFGHFLLNAIEKEAGPIDLETEKIEEKQLNEKELEKQIQEEEALIKLRIEQCREDLKIVFENILNMVHTDGDVETVRNGIEQIAALLEPSKEHHNQDLIAPKF